MLPGGLDIIGIFAMAPPAIMTTVQNKLKLVGNKIPHVFSTALLVYI